LIVNRSKTEIRGHYDQSLGDSSAGVVRHERKDVTLLARLDKENRSFLDFSMFFRTSTAREGSVSATLMPG